MSWSEEEEDLVQEAVDLIWREHGRVNGTPCYEAALRMFRCARAAEERGRRRGAEERRAPLKAIHEYCLHMFSREWLIDPRNRSIFAAQIFAIADAALAPRAQHASEDPPCAGCGHAKWWHQWSSKEHAFCCAPLNLLDFCRCENYLAPRDSGNEG